MMKKLQLLFSMFSILLLIQSNPVYADINIFACEPEWQALVGELGGSKVTSFSATTGLQDPHQVQARPSLISKMRNADLLVCSGADLEIGWLPVLLRRASNPALQVNKPGYFFAANHVRLLGIPKVIDRSQGDVHAAGNPHVQTNPKNIKLIAKALVKRMKIIDPDNASYYQERTNDFLARWKTALKRWKKQVRAFKGQEIVVQHASWDYLVDFTQLEQVATIEEKPGIPVTSGHLSSLVKQLAHSQVKVIIHAAYQDEKASKWLSKRSGIKVVSLPFTIGGNNQANDLFSLYDNTFNLLALAMKGSN
jgi:zinc/manganese transport system substrate-binding protein